jgi:hypothetical protein
MVLSTSRQSVGRVGFPGLPPSFRSDVFYRPGAVSAGIAGDFSSLWSGLAARPRVNASHHRARPVRKARHQVPLYEVPYCMNRSSRGAIDIDNGTFEDAG